MCRLAFFAFLWSHDFEQAYFVPILSVPEIVILISTVKRKISKDFIKDAFIPYERVRIDPAKDIVSQLSSKMDEVKKRASKQMNENFVYQYQKLLNASDISFENFLEYIDTCPVCKTRKLKAAHDYSKKNTTHVNVFIHCETCSNTFAKKWISRVVDTNYVYNRKIQDLLDEYISYHTYTNSVIRSVYQEFRRTEGVSLWPCQ